jgi:hypothetical protein
MRLILVSCLLLTGCWKEWRSGCTDSTWAAIEAGSKFQTDTCYPKSVESDSIFRHWYNCKLPNGNVGSELINKFRCI